MRKQLRAGQLKSRCALVCFMMTASLTAASSVRADEEASFFQGKTLSIVVGYAAGGGYDIAARALAKHIGAYLPGSPQIVVRNMPGAGSVVATNYMQSSAPRDGTVIASVNDSMLTAALLHLPGAQFEVRGFGWVGSFAARGTPIVYVRSDGPARSFAEAQRNVVLLGAAGLDATSTYPAMLNELLGSKFKTVLGYKGGTAEINLAIARGEVHGRASLEWESLKLYEPQWIASGFITVLIQMGLKPHPELDAIPSAFDLARDDRQRQIMDVVLGSGAFLRAYFAPPGVPPDRLAVLREAFAKTIADPAFKQDMLRVSALEVAYESPQAIEGFLGRVYKLPADVIEKAATFVGQ